MSGPGGPSPQDARPAQSPTVNGISSVVAAQIGVVVTWVINGIASHYGVAIPGDVATALNVLLAAGLAFAVSYVSAKARDAEWMNNGTVTGAKRLL